MEDTRAATFYQHLRKAVFNAFCCLEWTPDDAEFFFFNYADQTEDEYNAAAKLWIDVEPVWPRQDAVQVMWIVQRSCAQAALAFVRDVASAIHSMRLHLIAEPPQSATRCHELLVEAMTEWHQLECKGLMTRRLETLCRLEAEYERLNPIQSISEGPCEPNTWQKSDGTIVKAAMPPTAFLLLKLLWERPQRSMTIDDFVDFISIGADKELSIASFRNFASDVNDVFRAGKVKWRIEVKGIEARATLVNEYPKPKKNQKKAR